MKQACHIKPDHTFFILRRDHYNALSVVSTLRHYIRFKARNEEIAAYIKQEFFNHLEQHLIEEEMMLFPQLPPNDGLRLLAEEQHAALHQLAESCISITKTSPALAEEFTNLLEENIRFEERTLFPYLQKMVNKSEVYLN